MSRDSTRDARDYQRVAAAIEYIDAHARSHPSLDDVADAVGLSPHHFHRLFRRWAGTTPKRFLQLLTLEAAKRRLEASRSVLRTTFDVGLSGPGRLHDLFVTLDGTTPGEFAAGGDGLEITYGRAPTPFGTALIARTDRGLCHLAFLDADGPDPGGVEDGVAAGAAAADPAAGELAYRWPRAVLRRDDDVARSVATSIFRGDRPPLHVGGTNFQLRVWQALLEIPPGHVTSYGELAERLGDPRAARAVAGAVARNRVGWAIPCHRVIRKIGEAGGYRWGTTRKRTMLAWESVRSG